MAWAERTREAKTKKIKNETFNAKKGKGKAAQKKGAGRGFPKTKLFCSKNICASNISG